MPEMAATRSNVGIDAHELKCLLIDNARLDGEFVEFNDMELTPREMLKPSVELLRISTTSHVA